MIVTVEIFPGEEGVFAGTQEVHNLLKDKKIKLWSLAEGESSELRDTVVRIEGPYSKFGIFETVTLSILASSSAWVTAARKCKDAVGSKKVVCFSSRQFIGIWLQLWKDLH